MCWGGCAILAPSREESGSGEEGFQSLENLLSQPLTCSQGPGPSSLSSLPKAWGLEIQEASSPPDSLTIWVRWVLKLDPQGQILQ